MVLGVVRQPLIFIHMAVFLESVAVSSHASGSVRHTTRPYRSRSRPGVHRWHMLLSVCRLTTILDECHPDTLLKPRRLNDAFDNGTPTSC